MQICRVCLVGNNGGIELKRGSSAPRDILQCLYKPHLMNLKINIVA